MKIITENIFYLKKIGPIICLLFFTNFLFSQKKYNQLSIEARYGFNIPINPIQDISVSNYTLPNHIDIGIRYMFGEHLGLKIHYANDRFSDKKDKSLGNGYHRLGLEGVFNFSNRLNLFNNKNYNILMHAGVGITHAFPESIKRYKNGGTFTFGLTPDNTKTYERIGNIILGLTTQYRYSDKIALTFDATYVHNFEQQYSYNGELLYIDRTKVQGGFINFAIGIQLYFGKKSRHADWYNNSRKY